MTQENNSQRCIGFALVLVAIMFMTGCGPGLTVDLYDGPQRGDKDVATIMPQDGCWHCVKWLGFAEKAPIYTDSYPFTAMNETYPVPEGSFDSPVFVGKFRVPPGRYKLTIYMYGGKRYGSTRWDGYVDLSSGHTYHVKRDACFFCRFQGQYIWMEDAMTSEVLLGSRMPKNDVERLEIIEAQCVAHPELKSIDSNYRC